MVSGVNKGRQVLNFSEWTSYSPETQQGLLSAACQDATSGKMPGSPFTLLYPEAKLSAKDIETICAAARKA